VHTEAELARMQVEAIDSWHRARRMAEQAEQARNASREVRMDVSRRRDVLRAQHTAIVGRADRHLQDSALLLTRQTAGRAVLVHRNEWFMTRVSDELERQGVRVVEALSNGAEAVGVVVAEQPDLLLVEDGMPMLPGEAVVREARRFAPRTLVVGQVGYQDRIQVLLDAGAVTAYTRRVPPAEVARGLAELLRSQPVPA
jgi:CheY-like chemotaxis protein